MSGFQGFSSPLPPASYWQHLGLGGGCHGGWGGKLGLVYSLYILASLCCRIGLVCSLGTLGWWPSRSGSFIWSFEICIESCPWSWPFASGGGVLALCGRLVPTLDPCMSSGLSIPLYPHTGPYGNFWIPCVPSTSPRKPEGLLQGTSTTLSVRLAYLAMVPYCSGFSTHAGIGGRGEWDWNAPGMFTGRQRTSPIALGNF